MRYYLIETNSNDLFFPRLKNTPDVFKPIMSKKAGEIEYIIFKFSETGIKILKECIGKLSVKIILFFDSEKNAYLIDKSGIKTIYKNEKAIRLSNLKHTMKKSVKLKKHSDFIRKNDRRKTKSLFTDELMYGGISLIMPKIKKIKFYNSCERKVYRLRLYLPESKKNLPIIVFFHGAGAPGFDNYKQLSEMMPIYKRLKRSKKECAVISVQLGYDEAYNTNEYSEMLWNLINAIQSKYKNIDFSRIYLAGNSYGGYGAIYESFRYPNRYAAVISAVGWIYTDEHPQISYYKFGEDKYHLPFDDNSITELSKTPMWIACSNIELSYNAFLYEKLQAAGADVNFTRNDKYGHGLGRVFYRDYPWDEWIFNKTLT